MGKFLELKWGSLSITGNFRSNNEDKCFIDSGARFFLVADGMGGQCAGEKASELAIDIVSEKLATQTDFQHGSSADIIKSIDQAVSAANSEIIALGELEPSFKSMGTTITFVVVAGGQLYVGGVGDSRTYLLRSGSLQQLTEDHSLTQALVKAGTITAEDARTHRYKNVLYRYLGTKDGGSGTTPRVIDPQPGDKLLLCSDGVCDGVTNDIIKEILGKRVDPQVAAEELVQAAQDGGSKDNITCIVLHIL
ncbi:PP2C family protein-serine/threonine phosphatase [Planctomicrobium sp. SH664]|uniref:PP2C family protein-serine/threonine phosphatase n=1 Tax=Planctomicrobium sp. SH664 TaxID=3448125 RepID=UPI003F5C0187